MALELASEVELHQSDLYLSQAEAGAADDLVDCDGSGADQRQQRRLLAERQDVLMRRRGERGCPAASRGPTASSTSAAEVTSVAPSRMRRLHPSERGSRGEPGTAKT